MQEPKLVFVVNVWRDEALADRLVGQINQFYPESSYVVIPDVPRLKTTLTGEWSQRYLEAGLATDADVIIKLDPDTMIWRRAQLPVKLGWFGTVSGLEVAGGACGFSRSVAQQLVDSGLLMHQSPWRYPRYNHYRWPHEEKNIECVSLQDRTVAGAMVILGVDPTPWPDVLIWGNKLEEPRTPQRGRFAMTHPNPVIST